MYDRMCGAKYPPAPACSGGWNGIGQTKHQATRGLAHATSGPCLQQNLVTVLEGEA